MGAGSALDELKIVSAYAKLSLDFLLDCGIIYLKFAGLRDQLFPNRGPEFR
jgi:hypothetical protein